MKKLNITEGKMCLLLVAAILILCAGFFIVGCGVGPATKAVDTDTGNFALDFSDCPIANQCLVAVTTANFDSNLFQGKPLTFEAWVKPKSTSSSTILQRLSTARGAALKATSTASAVIPTFTIMRTVSSIDGVGSPPTSTVTYTVSSLSSIALNVWTHVAGMLVHNENSAATTAHVALHTAAGVTCTGTPGNASAVPAGSVADDSAGIAQDDEWHLDIYINGTLNNCHYAYGEETAHGNDPDPTTAALAYAHEPVAHTSGPGKFTGIVDEARVWNVERTITTCMSQELGIGGVCDVGDNALITYHTFNTGSGHTVYDHSGVAASGGKEYADGTGGFPEWSTGWTTDTPFE